MLPEFKLLFILFGVAGDVSDLERLSNGFGLWGDRPSSTLPWSKGSPQS